MERKTYEENLKAIEDYSKRGERFVYPEMNDLWKRQCASDPSWDEFAPYAKEACVSMQASILQIATMAMEALESGRSFEGVKGLIQDYLRPSGSTLESALRIIMEFSKVGPEFCMYMKQDEKLTGDYLSSLSGYLLNNKGLAELHPSDLTSRQEVIECREKIRTEYAKSTSRFEQLSNDMWAIDAKGKDITEELLKRGKELIWPEKANAWEKSVNDMITTSLNDEDKKKEQHKIANALYAIGSLEDGRPAHEVASFLSRMIEHPKDMTLLLVLLYSPQGPSVLRKMDPSFGPVCDETEKDNKSILEARAQKINLSSVRDAGKEAKAPGEDDA